MSSLQDIYSPSWIYLNFLLSPLMPRRLRGHANLSKHAVFCCWLAQLFVASSWTPNAKKVNIYGDSEVDLSVNQIFKHFFAGILKKLRKKITVTSTW